MGANPVFSRQRLGFDNFGIFGVASPAATGEVSKLRSDGDVDGSGVLAVLAFRQ